MRFEFSGSRGAGWRFRPALVGLAGLVAVAAVAQTASASSKSPARKAPGDPTVLHVLIAPEGLPHLHKAQENGRPVMRIPQFRLFDSEGRPLWAFDKMPSGFAKELEHRLDGAEPIPEARTFRQEARYFLRRGGLPLNLTTLPPTEFTVVEYWSDRCGICTKLSREVDRFFRKRPGASVKIVRVFIDIGEAPPLH